MIIAVDAAGGDFFPQNPVQGAVEAVQQKEGLTVLLAGPEVIVRKELERYDHDERRISVMDCPEVIGMDESPSAAVKSKQRSSIVMGLSAHKMGKCDAFVSSGNTGALLAASIFILGKLPNVQRPTIATNFPTLKGNRLLVDAGANLELKPEHYLQFARMGAIYCREVLGVGDPKVGLINVGEEPEKGTETLKEAYRLLKDLPGFVGNIEGRDIFPCAADVFLCDGLVGNILLKFGESIPFAVETLLSSTMQQMEMPAEIRREVAGVLKRTLDSFNYEHVGGVPFLGVNGVSMVGHGGSTPTAMRNMILNAAHCVEASVNRKIVDALGS